jgi:hypothetical protein
MLQIEMVGQTNTPNQHDFMSSGRVADALILQGLRYPPQFRHGHL